MELLPCPFCGSLTLLRMVAVVCDHCGAVGPLSETQGTAAESWNQRYFGSNHTEMRRQENLLHESPALYRVEKSGD